MGVAEFDDEMELDDDGVSDGTEYEENGVRLIDRDVGFLYISTMLKIMFKMIWISIGFTFLYGYPFIKR